MPNIDELTVKFSSRGVGTIVKNINNLATAIESLAGKSNSLDTGKISALANSLGALKGKIPTKGQIQRLENLGDAINYLNACAGTGDINGFASNISTVSSALGNLNSSGVKNVAKLGDAFRSTGEEAKKAAEKVGEVTKNAVSMKINKSKDDTETQDVSKNWEAADKFLEVNKQLEKATDNTNRFAKGLLNLKTLVPTDKMKNLQEQTEKTRQKYNELRESMRKALEAGDLKTDSKSFESKQKQLDGLRQKYEELLMMQKRLAQEGGAVKVNPNFGKAFSGIQQSVNGVKTAIGGVGSTIKSVNGYINNFISKIKSMGSASKKAKKDTASLTDTVKKLANEVTRLSKMLKLMVTRMALRAVIKEVGNGFKSLALHSQEFDNAMSNLINSSKTLGYSFSGMLAPLIMALAQPLLYIIGLLTQAINLINQLFSALTGASTWNKARDFTGKWSDDIKAANGAAKELKKTVLGFDELNQLQDKKTGGKSGADIKDMFDTMPIDDKVKEWAKKIKDIAKQLFEPIKKAWDKLGTYVKYAWKYAMNEVLALAKKVGKDFLKVWSQKETQKIFENILIIIGKIGETIGNLAKQFRKAWSENDTGLHILEHIRNIILIITEHIKNMAVATAEWASKLNFSPLLTAVEKWLASLEPVFDAIMGVLEDFYEEVALKFAKWVIESGLPALIDVFRRFNEAVDWEKLRSNLAELWKHLEPFMETVGEGLIIFIDRLSQKLAEFINGEKFEEFLQFIEDWMDSVTPEDVADAIEKLVVAIAGLKIAGLVISGLSGLATVLGGLVTIGKGIAGIVSGISSFAGAISSLGTACIPVIVGVAAIIVVLYSFIESYGGVEEAFKKLKEVVQDTGDYLKKVAEKVGLIPSEYSEGISTVERLKDSFGDLTDALGDAKGLWDTILGLIQTVVSLVGTVFIPLLDSILQGITEFIEKISGAIEGLSGVLDVLWGLMTGDKERAQKGADSFLDGALKSVGGTSGKGLADIIDTTREAYRKFDEQQENTISLAERLNEKQSDLGVSLGKLGDAHDETQKKFKTHADVVEGMTKKNDDLGGSFSRLIKLNEETSSKFKTHADELNNLKTKTEDTTGKFKTHNDVLNDMKKKQDDATNSLKPLKDAIDKSKEATDKLNSTFGDNKGKVSDYSGSLDALKEALDTAKDAEKGVVDYSPEFNKALQNLRKEMDTTSKDAEETGENIVNGIKEPLKNAKFDSEAISLKDVLVSALNLAFQIASPAKTMKPIGENIVLGVDEGMKDNFGTFNTTMSDFYNNYVKKWFDKDTWSFDGVGEGLKKTFEGAKSAIAGVWNAIADKLNGEHDIGESKIKIDLPKFAQGGFPADDSLFLANSSEMIGRFTNGKTAVANNAQIVEGIQNGVYNAVMSAMSQQNSGSSYISNEIIVDGEVIARSVTKAQEKQNRRFSPQTV